MSLVFLRRRGLGLGSVRGVSGFLNGLPKEDNMRLLPKQVYNGDHAGYVLNEKIEELPRADYLIRWGCTSETGGRFPLDRQINKSEAIGTVNNKKSFRRVLRNNAPDIIPDTYFTIAEVPDHGTFIVRPAFHAQGKKLWVAEGRLGVNQVVRRHGLGDWYASKLIDKAHEYRVYVVEGRVAAVAEKIPDDRAQVAWNNAKGAVFNNVRWDNWPLKAIDHSITAFNLSGLDFGGVDVMTDNRGNAYIIEINSAPSLPLNDNGSISYRQECMGKAFKYIMDNGRGQVPAARTPAQGWRDVIHPGIWRR